MPLPTDAHSSSIFTMMMLCHCYRMLVFVLVSTVTAYNCLACLACTSFGAVLPTATAGGGNNKMSEVSLSGNQLSSSIPPSWLALPTLVLDLSSNKLTGSVPTPTESNPVLRELLLGGNKLSGSVNNSLARYFGESMMQLGLAAGVISVSRARSLLSE